MEPVTNANIISKSQGLALLKAGRDGGAQTGQAAEPAVNAVSEAARTLGQHAAQARAQARQAPAVEKPATVKAAPTEDKPENEAQDNLPQGEPEGQDAEGEQTEQSADDDGTSATIEVGDDTKIVMDGAELTGREIKDSYLRRDDYSRKTAEVAEQRKVLDGVIGGVTQSRQRLDQLVGMLEQAVGQEPDWATLATQMQPQAFLAAKENWGAQQKVLQSVRQERDRGVAATIQQAKTVMFDEAKRTFRPDWQDSVKMQEGIKVLADFAVSQGIQPEELQQLYRTPMLKILDDAYRWNELQRTQRVTDKKVQGKPKPVRPGSQRQPGNVAASDLEAARQVWESNKRPTTKDAQAWLSAKQRFEQSTGKRA